MRYTARLVLAVFLLSCLMVWAQEKKEPPKPAHPTLTDKQKLEIRNAQVDWLNSKQTLEALPQYQQFVSQQQKLNEIVARVQRESGADPTKFQLQPTLEFTEIPQPKVTEKK